MPQTSYIKGGGKFVCRKKNTTKIKLADENGFWSAHWGNIY